MFVAQSPADSGTPGSSTDGPERDFALGLPATAKRIRSTLKRSFGLKRLREGQEAVILRVLAGQPTLAVMPTGAGKSLCYQLPALLLEGRTVVVSPLIALMKDQCESLCERGIAAVQLNSALDADALHSAEQAVADGSARIVLTTPERLADPRFMSLLQQHPTALLVVDEAHCISQWGHDFRPAFLDIAPALKKLGKPAVLALTATATESVTADITSQLGIAKNGVIKTGVYRPNLHYRVEQLERESDKLARVLALVQASEGSGLVYTATVKAAETLYEALVGAGESVLRYHGRLGAAERHAAQMAFMDGKVRIMVATNAFGLGIDKPDIRFVLHYQVPASLDAYYQESGRAGRDGQISTCTLLFLRSDKSVQQFFMSGRYPGVDDVDAIYRALLKDASGDEGWTIPVLQQHLHLPLGKLKVAVSLLRQQRVVTLNRKGQVVLLKKRLGDENLKTLIQAYEKRRTQDRDALEGMVFYAQTGQCRWRVVLDHLEEQAELIHCGHCDNCQRIAALQTALAERASETMPGLAASATAPLPQDRALPSPFQVEDVVKVKRYGHGTVVSADASSVTVAFEGGQRRSFLAEFVQRAASSGRRASR